MSYNGFRNRNTKNRPVAAAAVSAVITLLLFILACVSFFIFGRDNAPVAVAQENEKQSIVDNSTLEMRGMWIASTINIDYPSKQALSVKELEEELLQIVENAHELGINTLFFQVRPACDALYSSEIFPASRYVSGIQGQTVGDFDSLAFLLEAAKKKNIDVHAWVNPFRVTMDKKEYDTLAKTNPALVNEEYTVKYADGKTYLNPGIPEVRELVVSGVRELCENYPDLAGVHFDDYFYPYPAKNAEFDDEKAFAEYGNGQNKDDWRRENVNLLVKEAYNTVKEINPGLAFGISVFGIWANDTSDTYVPGSKTNGLEAYNELYCDALAWVKGGYVDYIIPQNYWSFDTKVAPFDEVARWWNANLDGSGVALYMGHAAYKSGDYGEKEIYRQVEMTRQLSACRGNVFYGYENIRTNVGGVADDIKKLYEEKLPAKNTASNGSEIKVNFPENNSYVEGENTYVLGSCDPGYALWLDGVPVSKTNDGYFSLYLPLEKGENVFELTQNGKTVEYVVNRGTKKLVQTEVKTEKEEKFEISNAYPSQTTWIDEGETLYLSCTAPVQSVVTAQIGEEKILLSPAKKQSGNSYYQKYVGEYDGQKLVHDTDILVLGNVTFSAQSGGNVVSAVGGEVAIKGADSYVYAEVKEDYTYTKVKTDSSFYEDFLPSSKGMRDYVTEVKDGYCKLRFGGYISKDELVFTYGKPLLLNTILTTAVEVNAESTLNNKANTTDIRFGVTENIPVDVDFKGPCGEMRIIIYNTDTSIIPQFDVPPNPLIKSIEGKVGTKKNMLMYFVTLKDENNFYGFNIVYEDGCMILKLNNPQTLAPGDKPLAGKKIIVDAGHGGVDSGALGPGNKPEKVLNQDIATRLADKLRNLGADVLESRPGDTTVDLYTRIDILNDTLPDMSISVHHNSIAGSYNALRTKGFMALYSNNSGIGLSRVVSDVVCRELGRLQKPTAYQELALARNHRFPSTLVEMCFISNVEEYQWSITEGNAERSAQALVNGILEYYRNQEKYLDY